jgi:phosphoglycerate dehydrogenase-like enzyme
MVPITTMGESPVPMIYTPSSEPDMPLQGLFILGRNDFHLIYGQEEQERIAQLVDIYAPPQTPESVKNNPEILADADVIFSGWNMCRIDQAFLDAAPKLKLIFYGGGSISGHIATPEAIARGITVTTAAEANSIPVAEYTLAMILFSLKHGWRLAREAKEHRRWVERNGAPGCFRRTVGLISMGAVARALLKRLHIFDLRVVAYDPFLSAEEADALGVELVPLDELFRRSDVVSLHTPELPTTVGLITGVHLSSLKHGGAFINTARGVIVRRDELIQVATQRPDLQFVLDVTETPERRIPEWPEESSPLYTLPNVVLTPHIAGSAGQECLRMGQCMVEELTRYLAGEPLRWQITPRIDTQANPAVLAAAFDKDKSSNGYAPDSPRQKNFSYHVAPTHKFPISILGGERTQHEA